MARSLFSSTAAPCLKCHATGDPQHDKIATAPNFLLAKERLKPDWAERWILDPQAISPGTSMPSGLFRQENNQWVFAGPTPPSFQGYDKDHSKLLVDYIFQLTPEEQRRVAASMGRAQAAVQPRSEPQAGRHRLRSRQRRFAVECCVRSSVWQLSSQALDVAGRESTSRMNQLRFTLHERATS